MTFTCPCCGSEIPVPPDVSALSRVFVGVKGSILRQLIAAYPQGATMPALITETYRGPDEPENAYHVIAIALSSLRTLLRPYGWTVPKNRGGNGYDRPAYRLEALS